MVTGVLLAAVGCTETDDRTATSASVTATDPTATSSPATTAATAPGDVSQEDLMAIMQAHLDAGELVGVRVSLLQADGTITEATVGTRTTDANSAPVDPDVPWGIGSATKMFVAVVALQLADEGRLDLDDGIDTYFADLADAERITPRQLLQHTSGLAEYLNDPGAQGDGTREWSPAEMVAVAEAAGRAAEPGVAYHYANTNYILLGEIIGQVTGGSWFDAVTKRIIEPLGLSDTGLLGAESAPGYVIDAEKFVEASGSLHPSLGGAAGVMRSTGRDLLHFITALRDGVLLSPSSGAAMRTFVTAEDYSAFGVTHSYGLGIEQYSNAIVTVQGHLGSGAAHSAFVAFDIDRGTAVAVGMNSSNPGPQAMIAIEALTAAARGAGAVG